MQKIRFLSAALIAPLAAPFLLWLFMRMRPGGLTPGDDLAVGIVGACSYVGFVIFGLPSIYLLRRNQRLTLVNVTLVGLLVGGTLSQLLPSLLVRTPDLQILFDPLAIIVFGMFGAFAAATFGLLAGIRRI
jgi:hypothetical protein